MTPRLLLVAGEGRRVRFWRAACERCGWPPPVVVGYADVVHRREILAETATPGSLLRLEPADDWDTYKLFLKHGAGAARERGYDALDPGRVDALEYDRGWLVKPLQAHLGFLRVLDTIAAETRHGPSLHRPADVALFFDKVACQRVLGAAGVPIPTSFGLGRDYDDIRERCRPAGRVMVKLAHGSGGAGCVALHWNGRHVRALTTVEVTRVRGEDRFYVSKRVRHVVDDEPAIARLVDRLCRERVQVEAWLPKARWRGRPFDLRVVTIGGEPRHAVARCNNSPFTNLTLGGRGVNVEDVMNRRGARTWADVAATCATVAALFPGSFTLGLDVLLRPDQVRHAVLEINAFGDLVLGALHRGEDTYAAILNAWSGRVASEALV